MLKRRRGARSGDDLERYLRRLAFWSPRRARPDLVAEARRHLYDATCRARRAGLSADAARRGAIRAFGPAWRIGLAARLGDGSRLHGAVERIGAMLRRYARGLRAMRRSRRARTGKHARDV